MPFAAKSHADSPAHTVLGAGVSHRKGEVRLFVRTASARVLLAFPESLACEVGRELMGLPAHPAAMQLPDPVRGKRHTPRSTHAEIAAKYLAIIASHAADPSISEATLCKEAGIIPASFYAWRHHQLRRAKHPVLTAAPAPAAGGTS